MQPNEIYKCFNPKVFLKSKHHLDRKIGSVYLKFEKKKTVNKAVHIIGSHS